RLAEDAQGVTGCTLAEGLSCLRQRLVGSHDVEDFLIAHGAEHCLQQMHSSIALRNTQRPQLKSRTEHVTYRIVRPHGLSILLSYEAAGRSHAEARSSRPPA